MSRTYRNLAATFLALGVLGTLGTTTACATYGYRPAAPSRERAEERRAYNAGYRDGLDEGRSDARHGRPFDPERSRRYRAGDWDYDRHYGPREEYAHEYREGFVRGYTEGYRNWRR